MLGVKNDYRWMMRLWSTANHHWKRWRPFASIQWATGRTDYGSGSHKFWEIINSSNQRYYKAFLNRSRKYFNGEKLMNLRQVPSTRTKLQWIFSYQLQSCCLQKIVFYNKRFVTSEYATNDPSISTGQFSLNKTMPKDIPKRKKNKTDATILLHQDIYSITLKLKGHLFHYITTDQLYCETETIYLVIQ